jgi:cytochrome c553
MGFRFAGSRPAALGSAAVLIFALGANAAMAQSAPAAPAPANAEAATKPGNAAAGQAKAAACGACHGLDGNSSDPQYPKLAGQSEQYIVRQLENFKSGKRQNPIMLGMATPLSEQDMHDIGAYFASKTPLPGVADQALVEHGQQLFREGDVKRGIPACMACHSIDGRGNPGAQYPQLESQHAQYVEAVLKAWQGGDAWGTDAHSQIMPAIATKLDANDIAAVASYIEGLHPATEADLAKPAAP